VESAVAGHEADVVFNCAAYNQVDVAEREPSAAFQVNALAVRHLALACRRRTRAWCSFRPTTCSMDSRTILMRRTTIRTR